MFETFGFENLTPLQASVWFGLAVGLVFGAIAEVTRFCFRRGLVGPKSERSAALGVWLSALVTAIIGTQIAISYDLISFDEHRFMASDIAWLAISLGGAAFGAGMVLTRGCVSRLTVLTGSGNLRALSVLLVFALSAHATLKGIFAPIRTTLGAVTLNLGETVSLGALPGGALLWGGLIAVAAIIVIARSGARPFHIVLAGVLGLLAPLAWLGTGFILFDEFDPITLESLSFTAPMANTLFWVVASTAIPAGFGTGLLGGVVLGAFLMAKSSGRFQWQSFESPRQTGRYFFGAILMGIGGVLAGGCSVGAGLSGVPTLSIAALLAILSIATGAYAMNWVLSGRTTS